MNKSKAAFLVFAYSAMVLLVLPGCSEKPSASTSADQGTNEPIVIEPKVKVGKVMSGMTMQQIAVALGKPDRRSEKAFEYAQLGLAVLADSNGIAKTVMCGDVTGINGPFVQAFKGRTKEALGMNSTREQVVKAYGEPDQSEKFRGGLESMQYQSLGMTFTLEGGKVHHIIVRLGQNNGASRTVTLEPGAQPDRK